MRSLWWHCWTLCALAAAPVIDVIRRDPAFLLANDFGPGRLAVLLIALLGVAPLPLALAAHRFRASSGRWPVALLAPPVFAIGLYLGGHAGLGEVRLLPATALAALFCWAYLRAPAFRSFVGWLALAALVAPIQLLADSGVRRVVSRESAAESVGGDESRRPPIAMLLLDELPTSSLVDSTGAIDRRRFPHLAALADTADWYTDFRSTDPATERAVPALLTGSVPPGTALPVAGDMPRNLFTLLAPHYRIAASETVTRLCPRDLNTLASSEGLLGDHAWLIDVGVLALHLWTPQSWAGSLLPPIERDWRRFPEPTARERPRSRQGPLWSRWFPEAQRSRGRDRVGKLRDALAAIDSADGPHLHFVHLMLPHRPWIYLPGGEGYLADGLREMKDFGRDRWPEQPAVAHRAYQRHLLQAEFTDRLVGEFLDRLRATGLFDRAVIVITADHGISFRPGDRVRRLSETNREDLLRVPLLIKRPGQREPTKRTAARSSLDLLPTLLDLAGIEPIPELEGHALLDPSDSEDGEGVPVDLRHRDSVFGTLSEENDLFRFGRHADWIGRTELTLEPHPEARLSLLGAGARVRREVQSATIPAWVYGWVRSALDLGGYGVAVTVNGTIAATGECERIEGRNRFNVLLPASALPPGEHSIDVVLIEPGTGRAWRLLAA